MNPECTTTEAAISVSGFTLLEVMIALAILAVAVTALFGSQSGSLSLMIEGKFNTTAALLAQDKLAQYRAGVEQVMDGEGDYGGSYSGFSWKTQVQDAEIEELPRLQELNHGLKRVDVTIGWQDEDYSATVTEYLRSDNQ